MESDEEMFSSQPLLLETVGVESSFSRLLPFKPFGPCQSIEWKESICLCHLPKILDNSCHKMKHQRSISLDSCISNTSPVSSSPIDMS